jgi:hypothetical protein
MFQSFYRLQVEIHNTEIIRLTIDKLFWNIFVFLIDDFINRFNQYWQ